MSKAFTRESDDAPESPVQTRISALPFGAKNYFTPDGARRLQAELERLTKIERPKITVSSSDLNTQQRLLNLDQQIQQLQSSLGSAVVVTPTNAPWEQVHFGATVTVHNRRKEEMQYRLVGVDETDVDRGWVSWLSPIARALLNARLGDRVRFKFPSGEDELEILRIEYE